MSIEAKFETNQEKRAEFAKVIKTFAEMVETLLVSIGPVADAMKGELEKATNDFRDFTKKALKVHIEEEGKPPVVTINPEHNSEFNKLIRTMNRVAKANVLTHRSILMSLISQYDAFVALLLRETYVAIPTKIDQSGKTFTLSELDKMGGVDEARARIIEDEIEDFLRKSHAEQITRLTKDYNFSPTLFKAELTTFIEAAQRRHLFVHNDGVVNRRYLEKCGESGCALPPKVELNKQIGVDSDYLAKAAEAVYSVGLKVGFGVWLQIYKTEGSQAGKCANELALELITSERFPLAIRLIEYALVNPKAFDDRLRRCLVLNLAQAYKWSGDQDRAVKILDDNDWSAMPDDLKIGEVLVRDDFSSACSLVRKLAHDPEWNRKDYAEWPIFRELIKQQVFHDAYREAYGEEFLRKVTTAEVASGAAEVVEVEVQLQAEQVEDSANENGANAPASETHDTEHTSDPRHETEMAVEADTHAE